MMREYNCRQLKMMQDRINWYKKDEISLKKLVNDLESLFNALENKDELFARKFLLFWGPLDDIYAFMVYENRNFLDELDKKDVDKGIENLTSLINEYFNQC